MLFTALFCWVFGFFFFFGCGKEFYYRAQAGLGFRSQLYLLRAGIRSARTKWGLKSNLLPGKLQGANISKI